MRKPNFFIIGAPKCGTTSLAAWLAEHPQVFFSPIKEPFFFNFDFNHIKGKRISWYEKLFNKANNQHIAVGEGTPVYLYSRTAVPAILGYVKHPRFIVMLRNPVDMAYSLHGQNLFSDHEDEHDFERAWEIQKVRVYGDRIPKFCNDPQLLMYGNICRVGEQLQRLFRMVPKNQVLVLNLDHIRQDPMQEYLKVLEFLGIEDDNRQNFPVHNAAKERNFPLLWRSIFWMNQTLRAVFVPHIRIGLTRFIDKKTRKERPRPPLNLAIYRHLQEYFAEDITLLEHLTGWDLSGWKLNAINSNQKRQ